MSFKENLLTKMKLDRLANTVILSVGHPDSDRKTDKTAMRELLELSPYRHQKVRDLELFILEPEDEKMKIFVLDNEMPIYRTTPEDVAMRRSPTLKEIISIRNAIKILNDSDVLTSKKQESVSIIHDECIRLLDLNYNESDIEEIEKDGVVSLEKGYPEGVVESLDLFTELLGYEQPPKPFNPTQHKIIAIISRSRTGQMMVGPLVIYSLIHNTIKLLEEPMNIQNRDQIELFEKILTGKEKAPIEGYPVFSWLKEKVMKKK